MIFKRFPINCLLMSFSLLNLEVNAAQDASLQRVQQIAEYTIKMQILDAPNPQLITQKLAELMVGNPLDHVAVQRFTDPIPVEGIANYLRKSNLQGLSSIEAKQMKPVIEKEIQQVSSMFRSCKIDSDIQKIQTDYLVEITCRVPKPNADEKNAFQQQLLKFKSESAAVQKINYLHTKQQIFAQSEYQDFKSTLWIEIEDNGILRAVIENDAYFPNIVIDQRDRALELRKSATD